MKFSLALASLSLLPAVLGHGHMTTLTVDGKDYTGPTPNGAAVDSVIRQINSIDPVKDLTSSDMSCGNGAANVTATQSASVNPGSTIAVSWISGSPPTLWPHNEGPLLTYIADCGGDCSKFNSLDAKWVKIDQASMVSGNTVASTGWVQNATFHQGLSYSFKLPSDTPSGNFLMRHEIIALHNAQSQGGAEFYPACSQITVSGDSTKALPTENVSSFPGTYSATDPGILIDVYTPPYGQYQFPGSALVTSLATGATASNNTSSSSSGTSGSGSGGSSAATTTAAASSLMPTTSSKPTTTQAPASNSSSSGTAGSSDDQGCSDDNSDDGSDDGSDDSTVTVTETIYVTATGSRMHRVHTATATDVVTVTPDAGAAAAVVTPTTSASATASPSPANLDGYPRRRSRIMARHHFASLH